MTESEVFEENCQRLVETLEEIFSAAPEDYEPSEEFINQVLEAMYSVPVGGILSVSFEPERIEFKDRSSSIH